LSLIFITAQHYFNNIDYPNKVVYVSYWIKKNHISLQWILKTSLIFKVYAEPGAVLPSSYREELLLLLNENLDNYSTDDINRMRMLLSRPNYLPLENRLRNFIRRNDGKVTIDFLDNLAIISNHLLTNDKPETLPEPIFWYGYYNI
jgi:hypothetical protein